MEHQKAITYPYNFSLLEAVAELSSTRDLSHTASLAEIFYPGACSIKQNYKLPLLFQCREVGTTVPTILVLSLISSQILRDGGELLNKHDFADAKKRVLNQIRQSMRDMYHDALTDDKFNRGKSVFAMLMDALVYNNEISYAPHHKIDNSRVHSARKITGTTAGGVNYTFSVPFMLMQAYAFTLPAAGSTASHWQLQDPDVAYAYVRHIGTEVRYFMENSGGDMSSESDTFSRKVQNIMILNIANSISPLVVNSSFVLKSWI